MRCTILKSRISLSYPSRPRLSTSGSTSIQYKSHTKFFDPFSAVRQRIRNKYLYQGGARNSKRQISNVSTPDFNAMGITEKPKTKIFQFCSKNPSGNHTWVYRMYRLYANIRKSYILYIFSDISYLNNILRYCKWIKRWKRLQQRNTEIKFVRFWLENVCNTDFFNN